MRFLVLGDGLLGLNATRVLQERGHEVRPLTRAQLDLAKPVPVDALGDATDELTTLAARGSWTCSSRSARALNRVHARGDGATFASTWERLVALFTALADRARVISLDRRT